MSTIKSGHIKIKIISNKAQCLTCDEIIESKYRHDFVTCKCGKLSVDGGLDYLRRAYDGPWKELSKSKKVKEKKDEANDTL